MVGENVSYFAVYGLILSIRTYYHNIIIIIILANNEVLEIRLD